MTKNIDIIGKWSIDIMYCPGAQEDTLIIFLKDGTGWIEYMNAFANEIDTFNWKILDSGNLDIVGKEKYNSDEGYSKSDINFTNLEYEIKAEETPSGIEMEVLTFSKPIWCYECRFGIETKELCEIKIPKNIRL